MNIIKKSKKKLLTALLSVSLLGFAAAGTLAFTSSAPDAMTVTAETITPENGLTLELTDDQNGYLIGGFDPKYSAESFLKTENGVTTLDLQSITAGTVLTTLPVVGIADKAFVAENGIQKVKLSSTMTYIGEKAFSSSPIQEINLEYVTEIGAQAFQSTKLHNLIIPANVTKIGSNAFYDASLSMISVAAESIPDGYASDWNGGKTFKTGVVTMGTTSDGFTYYTTADEAVVLSYSGGNSVTIPDTLDGKNVHIIPKNLFYNKLLTSVSIPDTITTIEEGAFYHALTSSIPKIVLSSSVVKIGADAFAENGNLATIMTGKAQGDIELGENWSGTATVYYDVIEMGETSDGYSYMISGNGNATITGYTGTETEIVLPQSITRTDGTAATVAKVAAGTFTDAEYIFVSSAEGDKNLTLEAGWNGTANVYYNYASKATTTAISYSGISYYIDNTDTPKAHIYAYSGTATFLFIMNGALEKELAEVCADAFKDSSIQYLFVQTAEGTVTVGAGNESVNVRYNVLFAGYGGTSNNINYFRDDEGAHIIGLNAQNSSVTIPLTVSSYPNSYTIVEVCEGVLDGYSTVLVAGAKEDVKLNGVASSTTIYYETLAITTEGAFTYRIDANMTAEIIAYSGKDTDLVIPEKTAYDSASVNVTAIAADVFAENAYLRSVTLPAALTTIGAGAFAGCINLKKATIGSSAILAATADVGGLYALVDTVVLSEKTLTLGSYASSLFTQKVNDTTYSKAAHSHTWEATGINGTSIVYTCSKCGAENEISVSTFNLLGASIRLSNNAEGTCSINFGLTISAEEYAALKVTVFEIGMILLPTDMLTGTLDINTANTQKAVISDVLTDQTGEEDNKDGRPTEGTFKEGGVYLRNIPAKNYARAISYVGYIKVGNVYYYTETKSASVNDVAEKAYNANNNLYNALKDYLPASVVASVEASNANTADPSESVQ